jgi:5-methylcytosine-specific restriction endonuclease McrA
MVWTTVNNYGETMRVRQLRSQCKGCGELVGASLRHELAAPDTPDVSRDLIGRRPYLIQQLEQQRAAEAEEWRQWYQCYLQTDEWRERRQLVFNRARGICEGCRRAPPTQVHHLTYKHAGNEFLWELVAICRDCHERYHDAV